MLTARQLKIIKLIIQNIIKLLMNLKQNMELVLNVI